MWTNDANTFDKPETARKKADELHIQFGLDFDVIKREQKVIEETIV